MAKIAIVAFVVGVAVAVLVAAWGLVRGPQCREGFKEGEAAKGAAEIRFMDKNETYSFLKLDADRFVSDMPDMVFQQRSVGQSKEGYIKAAARSAVSYVDYEKEVLTDTAARIDALLQEKDEVAKALKARGGMPPWVFALTQGDAYEEGNPHVRGKDNNIYFFSEERLKDMINNGCQLRWTLWYMRMLTLYPNEETKGSCNNVRYNPGSNPLNVGKSKLPAWYAPNWDSDPLCAHIPSV